MYAILVHDEFENVSCILFASSDKAKLEAMVLEYDEQTTRSIIPDEIKFGDFVMKKLSENKYQINGVSISADVHTDLIVVEVPLI